MRDAGALLAARPLLGRERLARGAAEGLGERVRVSPAANLQALLAAYARVRLRGERRGYAPRRRAVVTMADALAGLTAVLPGEWTTLAALMPPPPLLARSGTASALAAALELTRAGKAWVRQDHAFAPVKVRAR